ncbi:hypothetical protein [Aureimonas sp. AU20]|uniref:hypothetical protein n=1 Tax=Aureimonas sp. AU20 TaxID=1349819 RepID=UPI0007227984|nr:hypothetical protein [Aureimonas sp. AU20]ALN73566.1 hypothetical protein M673_12630 [Aureimonas sp. AU20]
MKDITHTPGPWHVAMRQRIGITVRAAEEKPIADIWQNGDDPMANARLIAAAPDLLKALQTIAHIAHHNFGRQTEKLADIEPIAREAISKASPNLPSASQEGGE